jgi:hypothetical protein
VMNSDDLVIECVDATARALPHRGVTIIGVRVLSLSGEGDRAGLLTGQGSDQERGTQWGRTCQTGHALGLTRDHW